MPYEYAFMIPDIESFRLVPHMTNIIECLKIPKFSHDPYGRDRKWHFSTSGGAANLGGVYGDLFEHRGSGIPLLGITSLFMHKMTGLVNATLICFIVVKQSCMINPVVRKINISHFKDSASHRKIA